MTLSFQKLRGSEVLTAIQDEEKRQEFFEIPFMAGDEYVDIAWGREKFEAHNVYIVAFSDSKPVGAIKYYMDLPGKKEHLNNWLASQGMSEIQGRMFHGSYVAVHPAFRRKGIGVQLNNMLIQELKPGDVFVFSSHEPDGAKLNASWFSQLGGSINVIFAKNYADYKDYDPTRKNFVISDPDNFKHLQKRVASAWMTAFKKAKKTASEKPSSQIAIVYIQNTRTPTTFTLATCDINGPKITDTWLEPHPIGISEMTDFEVDQLRRLAEMVPRWLDDGVGRVSALSKPHVEAWAKQVVVLSRALETAQGDEAKWNLMVKLHELCYPGPE